MAEYLFFGAPPASADPFFQVVDVAAKALYALPKYSEALRKKADGWFVSADRAAQLRGLADAIDQYHSRGGPSLLGRAIQEKSAEKLNELQRQLRNVTEAARSEVDEPSEVSEFMRIVVGGSLVDTADAVRRAAALTEKTVDRAGQQIPWIAGAVIVVSAAYLVPKLLKASSGKSKRAQGRPS